MARKKQGVKSRDVNAAVRAAQALDHFLDGHGYQAIADFAGYASAGAAYNAIQRELSRIITPKAEQARKIEIQRLLKLLTAMMPRAMGQGDDAAWASARCVAIIEQLGKFQGAYPTPEDAQDKGVVREYIGLDLSQVVGSNGHATHALPDAGSRN